MSTKSLDLVRECIRAYKDQWKVDHDRAMQCLDFETYLQLGLQFYEQINFLDEAVRSGFRMGVAEFDQTMFDGINSLYSLWLEPCDDVLNELKRFEDEFGEIEHAEAFRSAIREVRGLLTPDEEFFSHDELVAVRDDAIESFRAGSEEVWE